MGELSHSYLRGRDLLYKFELFMCVNITFPANNYVYFESSLVRRGDESSLAHYYILYEECFCVVFDFHMYGTGIGNLTVHQANYDQTGDLYDIQPLLRIEGSAYKISQY